MEERAVVVTRAVGSQRLVLDYSPGLDGLERDMPLQQALSLNGEMEVLHADVQHYRQVFDGILDALELKSPLVEGIEPGETYLGLDGLQAIYTSDDILVKSVREALPAVFDARLGMAAGKFPAYAAALYSPPGGYQSLSGNIAAFLENLSCDLLPVSAKSRERLHTFGLHTLGQLAAMPQAHLEAQFGPEGRVIRQLAGGADDTPLYPRLSQEIIEESTILPAATTSLDILIMSLENILTRALVRLYSRGMGIQSINLWTRSWMGEHWEQDVRFKEPAMHTREALSRIRQMIENSPQPGPVEQLGMRITGTGRPTGRQKSLLAAVRAREHLLDEIKQLELRLGAPQLFQVREVEPWSRIPERRYALAPLSR
jgi:DNA polymerase-4/protein ImuB